MAALVEADPPARVSKPKRTDITFHPVEQKDLPELAAGMAVAFGDSFWNTFEPPELRPSDPKVRWQRNAYRTRHFFQDGKQKEGMLMEKACLPDGKIIGTAWWYKPGTPIRNHWNIDPNEEKTPEIEESLVGFQVEPWNKLMQGMDSERIRLMGDEPHWFIAPLWVLPEYHGQGIGRMLLQRIFDKADASSPPVPVYLEAMPDAVEFYKSLNFKAIPDTPAKWEYVRRGPAPPK